MSCTLSTVGEGPETVPKNRYLAGLEFGLPIFVDTINQNLYLPNTMAFKIKRGVKRNHDETFKLFPVGFDGIKKYRLNRYFAVSYGFLLSLLSPYEILMNFHASLISGIPSKNITPYSFLKINILAIGASLFSKDTSEINRLILVPHAGVGIHINPRGRFQTSIEIGTFLKDNFRLGGYISFGANVMLPRRKR